MERGFMKLWRKLKDSRCYSRGGVHRALLLTLFTEVNWKEGHFRGETIGPGQIAVSVVRLADELGFPRTTIQRALADLITDGVIFMEVVGNRWTRITLVNWSSYNNVPEEVGQPVGSRRAADGQLVGTIKELKKKEDIGENTGASFLSTRSSAAFRPPTVEEVRSYCEARRNGLDAEAFVPFYQSNGWKVGRNPMRDWQAAVRTWESKRQEDARAEARAEARGAARARAGQGARPVTVAQQRYAEQDMMARMLLTDRERRNHAQNRGHAADSHRPEPALPPGW